MADEEFNLETRVLCSDGACIGVVGEDGKCKVCGLAYDGEVPLKTPSVDQDGAPIPDLVTDPDRDASSADESLASAQPASLVEIDAEERICCSDEMCVGIIGENGLCGICGKA